jgi:hypothetical protein
MSDRDVMRHPVRVGIYPSDRVEHVPPNGEPGRYPDSVQTLEPLIGPSLPRRLPLPTSRAALAVHTALLAVVLLLILPLVNTGQVGFPDEGIYSAQVDNLSRGSWSAPRQAPDIDFGGVGVAAAGSTIIGDSYIPYARQPLYPLVLLPAFELGGLVGMLVLSVFGTVLAALAAALLARRIDPSLGIAALWTAGVGSPLLFDAHLVMGHSLVAALAGLLAVTVCAVVDDRRTVWLWASVPCAVALTLIRSEGVLVVLALGAVVGLSACKLRPRPSIDVRKAVAGATLGATAAVTYIANQRWAAAILGSGSGGEIIADRDPDPLSSGWASLLRPWTGDARLATAEAVLMTLCTLLAVVTYRLLPRFRLLSLGLLVMASVSSVFLVARPPNLITGLIPVFPAAVLGLGLLRREDFRLPEVSRMLATSLLVTFGILATSYGIGGAAEWGGRFYHVLIPLLVAPAVLGLSHARATLPKLQLRVATAALAVMVLAIGVTAVRSNHRYREFSRIIVDESITFARESSDPPAAIVVAPLQVPTTPRLFWRQLGQGDEIVTSFQIQTLGPVIAAAAESGRKRLVVLTDIDSALFAMIVSPVLEDLGWTALDARQVEGTQFTLVELGPETEPRS